MTVRRVRCAFLALSSALGTLLAGVRGMQEDENGRSKGNSKAHGLEDKVS